MTMVSERRNASRNRLLVGAAKVEITPTDLTGLNPMGHTFDTVHDRTFVRVIVAGNGHDQCAIIAADLIEVGDTRKFRGRVQRQFGIAAGRVLIAPSHSHNAPRIGLVPPGGKARKPSPESLAYTEIVYDAMIDALQLAVDRAVPAGFAHGSEQVDVNTNRDIYRDGEWRFGSNPNGPSDKTLTVLAFQTLTQEPIALLMNYAVHPTVTLGTLELSGDLAGVASRYVEAQFGSPVVAMWTSGALGDQAPRIALDEGSGDLDRDREFAYAAAESQGMLIGATAVDVLSRINRYDADVTVAGDSRTISCPARRLEVPPGMEQANVDNIELDLSCITIGSVALAGVPGEMTVPMYRNLRAASPLATTLVVSNANARVGYLTEDEAYSCGTKESRGNPIIEGYAEQTIVPGLVALITESQASKGDAAASDPGLTSQTGTQR